MGLSISQKLAVRLILIANLMRSRVNPETTLWGRSLMPFPERINEGKGPPPEWAASPNRHPGKERSRRNQCHGWPPLLHAGQYVCSSVLATAATTTATSSSTNIRLPLLQPSNIDRTPATLPSEPDRACWGTQLHGLNTNRVLSPSGRQAAPAGPLRSILEAFL